MKLLSLIVVALLAAVGLALVVLKDPGYVLIAYGDWTVETTLSLFILALVVLTVVGVYGMRLLRGLWHIPARVHDWNARRHRTRALAGFNRGLVALTEGRWKSAEREMLRFVRHSEAPMLNYLSAAQAAEHQGASERRDRYLRLAYEVAPKAELPVGLTQAQLQIAHQQQEQALATLTHLRSVDPGNDFVLELLMRLYRDLRDWDHLRELVPQLRRRRVLSEDQARELEREVFCNLLEREGQRGDAQGLMGVWAAMPKYLQEQEPLVVRYVSQLMKHGAGGEAEPLVRSYLRRKWSEPLVRLYGMLEGKDPARQLESAEEWAKERGRSAMLLLTLGRLAMRNRLWGKARGYLEASVGAEPSAEAYRELAALLEHMGENEAAMARYREGILMAVQDSDTGVYLPAGSGGGVVEAGSHTQGAGLSRSSAAGGR